MGDTQISFFLSRDTYRRSLRLAVLCRDFRYAAYSCVARPDSGSRRREYQKVLDVGKGECLFWYTSPEFFRMVCGGTGWYLLFSIFGHPKENLFNILYILPILFYGSFVRNASSLYKINKKMAVLGATPAMFWTMISAVSLILLFFSAKVSYFLSLGRMVARSSSIPSRVVAERNTWG